MSPARRELRVWNRKEHRGKFCIEPQIYTACTLSVAFLLVNMVTHVGGDGEDIPVRQTKQGKIQGYVHTLFDGQEVERYLGVPFAKPPIGDRRFELPIPPSSWQGIRKTVKISSACMQQEIDLVYIRDHFPSYTGGMSEDCLYLNVYVPRRTGRITDNSPFSVLVHVHGGSNEVGMGAMFHGDTLATFGGFIVVTFNYRVGALGFLSVPHLGIQGNFGLYDQDLAFRWVQENIANFGGDPSKVTIQGHSAGSVDAALHVLSPVSKGLFRYAILLSGSPTAYWAISPATDPEDESKGPNHHLLSLGCYYRSSSEKTLRCLKRLNATTIAYKSYEHGNGMFNFSPVIDQIFVMGYPGKFLYQMLKAGVSRINAESIMIGVVKDEGSPTAEVMIKNEMAKKETGRSMTTEEMMVDDECVEPPSDFDEQMYRTYSAPPMALYKSVENMQELSYFVYKRWDDPNNSTAGLIGLSDLAGDVTFTAPAVNLANLLAHVNSSNLFLYRFEHISSISGLPKWMGVPHGEDLFYLFGSPVEGHTQRNYTELDKRVSMSMMRLWSSFLDNGQPTNPEGSPALKPYGKKHNFIRISTNGTDPVYKNDKRLRARYMAYWNYLIPNFAKPKEKPVTSGYEIATWVLIGLLSLLLIICLVLVLCLINYRRKFRSLVLTQSSKEEAGNMLL